MSDHVRFTSRGSLKPASVLSILVLLAILLVAALLPGEARAAFARNGPEALPESAGASFNSSFNGSHGGWSGVSGPWTQTSTAFTTAGKDNLWSSIKHSGEYTNFVYSARMKRTGSSSSDLQGLLIRGDPSTLTGDKFWSSAYYFVYDNDGSVSIGKSGQAPFFVSGSGTNVAQGGWNVLQVIAYKDGLTFSMNGERLLNLFDPSHAGGSVGIGMFRSGSTTNNKLSVDWATLYVIKY